MLPAGVLRPAVTGLPRLDRCLVLGILNVTPDSFSDGNRHYPRDAAVEHGLRLAADGADVVDVGGESTRPGARRVTAAEELRRVLPVVRDLVASGVTVSVDTMRARVAEAALAEGARLVNDVSGGLADPDMARVVAGSGVAYVAMHWRGHSERMRSAAAYTDVVAEVVRELSSRLDALVGAGVSPGQIVVDPGLGFAKLPRHDWALLRDLGALRCLGRPLLVGASRKTFLAAALAGGASATSPPPEGRDPATTALTALLADQGVFAVRVHDVAAGRQAVAVVEALKGSVR